MHRAISSDPIIYVEMMDGTILEFIDWDEEEKEWHHSDLISLN